MKLQKMFSAVMASAIFLSGTLLHIPVAGAESAGQALETKKNSYLPEIIATKYEKGSYSDYLSGEVPVPMTSLLHITPDALDRGTTKHITETTFPDTGESALLFDTESKAEYMAWVEKAGYYRISIRYCYRDGGQSQGSSLSIALNGEVPFQESANYILPRMWGQESCTHLNGTNDLLPKTTTVEIPAWYTAQDASGYEEIYYYKLKAGENRITLSSKAGGFAISEILLGEETIPSYSEKKKSQQAEFSEKTYTVQGEEIYQKNDSSITAGFDRSDSSVVPNDPVYKKVNVLDGSKFSKPAQQAVWKFHVTEPGRYRIGIRYKQDTLQGLFVTRKLTLNGEPVCRELNNIHFTYNSGWEYMVPKAGNEDIFLELEAGDYDLGLEVVLGDMSESLSRLDELVFALNYLYRKIIMVTSTTPDPLRDYNLDDEIPFLVPVFQEIEIELQDIYEELTVLSGQKGGQLSVLTQMQEQLRSFIREPYYIQDRLDSYKGNITAISSLVMSLQEQPLSIDYLSLIGQENSDTNVHSGFFGNLWFQIKAIVGSFYCDYATLSGIQETETAESIRVWFGGGREQAELLKSLIDDSFSKQTGIGVNLQLVTIPLSQAVLAGTAPDVSLSTVRSQPVNLGARGVLADLSVMEGFEAIKEAYGNNLLLPYTYRDAVYALPVTLDYHMMFYRRDILQELGLDPPQTWEEFYDIIPVLQRNNMAIGLPYTVMSSQATIESGIGARDIFATLVLQNGASLYSDDLTEIVLDNPDTVAAFEQWTKFYTEYQLDLQFDFANRFRTGEMPLAIQGYSAYNMLSATAPEIRGLWEMTLIPGVERENGIIDRTESASGSGVVMLKDTRHEKAAWEFIKWWVSAQTQADYGNELEMLFGKASRYNPASAEAMTKLMWDESDLELLLKQREFVKELPEVLGGYYTSRGLDNAFRNVVLSGRNYREALREQEIKINAEFVRKQREFQATEKNSR